MASMFRDFSFGPVSPPAYSLYEAERVAMNVSPSSQVTQRPHPFSRPPTPPPCTMGDLAAKLNQQSLRINTQFEGMASGPLTPPSDDCASPTDAAPLARPTYSRITSSLLRMQRQSNSRMQCSTSHMRDVTKLVKMIEEEAQCTVSDSSSRTSSTSSSSSASSGDDEGVDMDYDLPARKMQTLGGGLAWRSVDSSRDTCIRVAKPVRMRKRPSHTGVTKKRSS
ncbi:hypothetical protein ACN47E_005466 [Coniothyrium glycines]